MTNNQLRSHYILAKSVIILLSISAFGPYIIPHVGMRLEHLIIYSAFLFTLLFFSRGRTADFRLNAYSVALLFLLGMAVIWISIVSIFRNGLGNLYEVIAALENFIQPVALVFIISFVCKGLDWHKKDALFRLSIFVMIVLLCINSLIAVVEMFVDTWTLTKFFVSTDMGALDPRETVWGRAVSNGRFLGVFNQPCASGIAYSISLLGWVYLVKTSKKVHTGSWPGLVLLLAGGVMSVSKVFILGGLLLSIALWFWMTKDFYRVRKKTLIGGTFLLFALCFFYIMVLGDKTLARFFRYFDYEYLHDRGFIDAFTAGRFGSETSGVKSAFIEVWQKHPFTGFGAPKLGAVDSAYLEIFYYGGSFALFLNVVMFMVIGFVTFKALKKVPPLGKFLAVFWVFVVGVGIGAPVLTINRSSIFIWIILVISFGLVSEKKFSKSDDNNSAGSVTPITAQTSIGSV